MGTKKQAEKSKKLWVKVLAVVVGVVFVVLMVVSAMGSSWISSLASVKPGDTVVVDYTLKDAQGSPIMTSNQQLFTQLASKGSGIMYSKTLTLTANQTLGSGVYPVSFYTASTGWSSANQFALLPSEYNTITEGLVGMRANTQKTISLTSAKPMTQFWSADQLAANNVSLSSIQVGDHLTMGVSTGATADEAATTAPAYARIGEVTNKTADGITVDFSYPSIDVTVTSINPTSG